MTEFDRLLTAVRLDVYLDERVESPVPQNPLDHRSTGCSRDSPVSETDRLPFSSRTQARSTEAGPTAIPAVIGVERSPMRVPAPFSSASIRTRARAPRSESGDARPSAMSLELVTGAAGVVGAEKFRMSGIVGSP
jgi:hypothetical protein